MKNLTLIISLAVFVIVQSCKTDNQSFEIGKTLEFSTTANREIQINAKMGPWSDEYSAADLLDTLYIVQLSSDEYISDVTKLLIHQDIIYIFDELRQGIFSFDIAGNFLGSIEQIGRGPGEFVKIADFDIDEEKQEILILDQFNRKILHFSLQCEFIREVRFTTHARYFGVLKDSYLLYNDFNSRWGDINYTLFRTLENGEVLGHLFEFDPIYFETNREKHSYITTSDSKTLDYIGHYDNTWYRIDEDSIWKAYTLDFGEYNIQPGVVHNSFEALDDFAHTISYFFENSNYLTFAYLFKKNLYIRYYDKESDFLIPNWIGLPHEVYYNFNFPVKAVYQDFFVNAIDPEMLSDLFKSYPQGRDFKGTLPNKHLAPILDQYMRTTEEDNMILSFYKIKTVDTL